MDPIHENLQSVFRDVFESPTLAITDATTARDVPGWDSLMHIQLVVAVERKFGIRFGTGEIEGLQNVGDMIALLRKKTAAKGP